MPALQFISIRTTWLFYTRDIPTHPILPWNVLTIYLKSRSSLKKSKNKNGVISKSCYLLTIAYFCISHFLSLLGMTVPPNGWASSCESHRKEGNLGFPCTPHWSWISYQKQNKLGKCPERVYLNMFQGQPISTHLTPLFCTCMQTDGQTEANGTFHHSWNVLNVNLATAFWVLWECASTVLIPYQIKRVFVSDVQDLLLESDQIARNWYIYFFTRHCIIL